jgi:hypothetical protein
MVDRLDFSGLDAKMHPLNRFRDVRGLARFLFSVTVRQPAMAWHVLRLVGYILKHNPRAIRTGMYMASFYAHFGPFSQAIIAEVNRQLRILAAAQPVVASGAESGVRFASVPEFEPLKP